MGVEDADAADDADATGAEDTGGTGNEDSTAAGAEDGVWVAEGADVEAPDEFFDVADTEVAPDAAAGTVVALVEPKDFEIDDNVSMRAAVDPDDGNGESVAPIEDDAKEALVDVEEAAITVDEGTEDAFVDVEEGAVLAWVFSCACSCASLSSSTRLLLYSRSAGST